MNRIKLFAATAAIGFISSCQVQEIETPIVEHGLVPVMLKASYVQTKVAYTETNNDGIKLHPAWEEEDIIIGFDGENKTYTFAVSEVNATTGEATLTGNAPADCSLHLIYLCGATASSISNGSVTVDYTNQAGDETMPAVMLSDGEVSDGCGSFTFHNAGAVIGISAVKGAPQGSTISKITVEGENLSAATVALSGSALALTAATAATDAISTAALSGLTVTDANGTLSTPLYIAVPASAVIKKVSASVAAREPEEMKVPSTADDYVEIEAMYDGTNLSTKKWAKWNVGANSQSEYGWYFAWGGTEGYVYKNSQWVSASGVDTYSYALSSAKTANANDYLYVRTQSFTPAGHSFDWAHTPYQTQNITSSSSESTKFTKYLGSTSSSYKDPSATDEDALKTVLDLEDDAARANWGGNWRMPTSAEFKALYQACGGTGDSTMTLSALSSASPGQGIYWVSSTQPYISEYTGVAGCLFCDGSGNKLFFPAAGFGKDASRTNAGNYATYWSSSLFYLFPFTAHDFFLINNNVRSQDYYSRRLGLSVRPLSD